MDRLAEPFMRDGRRRDPLETLFGDDPVKRAQMREKMRRRLSKVACHAQIERVGMIFGRMAEGEKGFVRVRRFDIEPQ